MITQECAPLLYAALVEAKKALWIAHRHMWNRSDFDNFPVVQQINAALTFTDGEKRP